MKLYKTETSVLASIYEPNKGSLTKFKNENEWMNERVDGCIGGGCYYVFMYKSNDSMQNYTLALWYFLLIFWNILQYFMFYWENV